MQYFFVRQKIKKVYFNSMGFIQNAHAQPCIHIHTHMYNAYIPASNLCLLQMGPIRSVQRIRQLSGKWTKSTHIHTKQQQQQQRTESVQKWEFLYFNSVRIEMICVCVCVDIAKKREEKKLKEAHIMQRNVLSEQGAKNLLLLLLLFE